MSLRALSNRASWRDTKLDSRNQKAASSPGRQDEVNIALVDGFQMPKGVELTAESESVDELQKAQGALVDCIPTEVLAPYTAIVAIIVANASTSDTFTALRWWSFSVSLSLIIAYGVVSYRQKPSAQRPRKLPFVEIVGALIAFAAWGLAMPGSPLSLSITGSKFAITSAIISMGGATVLGLLSLPLKRKSTKATSQI